MVESAALLTALARRSVYRCVGVPDSTLAPFFGALAGDTRFSSLIATNECEAMAIAMGQYLGGAGPSLVFLQNSGFGKTIHPITSLLAREICAIPALLLIGWRGCPDPELKPDEPQHAQMGRILTGLLQTIEIPFEILAPGAAAIEGALDRAFAHFAAQKSPFALIARPGYFGAESAKTPPANGFRLGRRQVLERVTERLARDTAFVSTTGKTSRELYAIREARGQAHDSDFYTVGGMGCASAIALGVCTARPDTKVCVFDGDGAALMQLGNFATIGQTAPRNLLHVLIDNRAHESTGGQPTASGTTDLAAVARACGYADVTVVRELAELDGALQAAASGTDGPRMIVVQVALGSDAGLGRPTRTPRENAESFHRKLVP